jgi:hypothetical protein
VRAPTIGQAGRSPAPWALGLGLLALALLELGVGLFVLLR